MSKRIHALAQTLTGKASVEECSLEEVRSIAQRYPFYAPAQFLLLQKLKQADPGDTEKQQQKAILYFHDPLLFNSFISSEKFYRDEPSAEPLNGSAPIYPAIPIVEEKEVAFSDENPVNLDESSVHQPLIKEEEVHENVVEEEVEEDETSFDELEIAIDLKHQDESEAPTMDNSVDNSAEAVKSSQIINDQEPVLQQEAGNKISQQLDKPVAVVEQNQGSTTELSFEPFHTVDYFASQGIKITLDELPKDKLGKQLKSFTEWLKTMKRLPTTNASESGENIAEKKVENMATHSVTESNVVTEAMAEVWAKQGNKEKALDIYSKLSLLNPSKKAYFAAKIETLKLS